MRLLFVSNQGGLPVVDLNCAVATQWLRYRSDARAEIMVWFAAEKLRVEQTAANVAAVHCYENFLATDSEDWKCHVERLNDNYPAVNWAAVIASERSFTDSSFLLGGGGNRKESHDYVTRILVNTVRFLESVFKGGNIDAVVCQTADSFFTHVLFKVAGKFGVPILAIKPTWFTENDEPGFCMTSDEYTHAPAMISAYRDLENHVLTESEGARAEKVRARILNTDLKVLVSRTVRRSYIVGPLSPNLKRLPAYLLENRRQNKELNYLRFDPVAKARANILRVWRRWRVTPLLGSNDGAIPDKYVFFPLQFQPEQSTLVGGIFFANQIAVAENLAKALPLGWTLVIKEHPKGRGSRPAWQYRHLTSFPNVMFVDVASRNLIKQAGAVVTITSTIALEALALDRPVLLLGKTYFDYADILYRPESWPEIADLLRRLLVEKEYERRDDRQELIRRFLLSFVLGTRPGFPSVDNAPEIARAIEEEIEP